MCENVYIFFFIFIACFSIVSNFMKVLKLSFFGLIFE